MTAPKRAVYLGYATRHTGGVGGTPFFFFVPSNSIRFFFPLLCCLDRKKMRTDKRAAPGLGNHGPHQAQPTRHKAPPAPPPTSATRIVRFRHIYVDSFFFVE